MSLGHGHGHRHDGAKPGTSPSTGGPRWTPPAKDFDPVCGMTIDTAGSKSSVDDGHVYYFCSQDCREKFEASPRSYTSGAAGSPHNMEDKFVALAGDAEFTKWHVRS
jgi:YHS domain-containing protein